MEQKLADAINSWWLEKTDKISFVGAYKESEELSEASFKLGALTVLQELTKLDDETYLKVVETIIA